MNWFENIELAFTGLFLNKMRSLLTMLGIIIGIGSVIAIFTIGNSFEGYLLSELQGFGASNITVAIREKDSDNAIRNNSSMDAVTSVMVDENSLITQDMIDQLEREYENEIAAISLSQTVGVGYSSNNQESVNVTVIGGNNAYLSVNDVTLIEGRYFTDYELNNANKVAIISEDYVENLKVSGSIIGENIEVITGERLNTYTVVGIYESEDTSSSLLSQSDVASNLYIPLSLGQKQSSSYNFQNFMVSVNSDVNAIEFAQVVSTFMNNFYIKNLDYEIQAISLDSVVETMSGLIDTLKIAISAIAALALLVGGIGVMNIMYVSITERTKEIGTRKALGATNVSIQMQFITESVILTLVGGVLGIVFGLVLGLIGSTLLGFPGAASITDILLAVGTSMVIGIFFGYYPSNKAAKMDPIEALRYE